MKADAPGRSREVLRRRGVMAITLVGGCMAPAIRKGEMVLMRRPESPRVGDVAVIETRGRMVVHRIRARIDVGARRWYVHRGDASAMCGVASPRDIVGLVANAPRPGPSARWSWEHVLALALRLGALLHHMGAYPGRAVAGSWVDALRQAPGHFARAFS